MTQVISQHCVLSLTKDEQMRREGRTRSHLQQDVRDIEGNATLLNLPCDAGKMYEVIFGLHPTPPPGEGHRRIVSTKTFLSTP